MFGIGMTELLVILAIVLRDLRGEQASRDRVGHGQGHRQFQEVRARIERDRRHAREEEARGEEKKV